MSTSLGRKSGAIITKGSNKAGMIEVDSSGTITGSLLTLPIIASMTWSDQTEQAEKVDEGANTYRTDSTRTVTAIFEFLQKDRPTLEAMVETYRGKFFRIIKEMSNQTIEGSYQYWMGAICKVVPNLEYTYDGNTTWEFALQVADSDIGQDVSTFDNVGYKSTLTGTYTVLTDGYWTLFTI